MRVIGALLVAAAATIALAADAQDEKAGADRIRPVLGRLAKMSRTEQQTWLRRLEDREKKAAAISLASNPAKAEADKVHRLLHRKLATWAVLREAIETTDAREQDAIAKLLRRYREQVFETFYARVDEYGRRQEAWNTIKRSWQAAGRPFDQQERLIDWLERAIKSVDPKATTAIPTAPDFDAVPPEQKQDPARPEERKTLATQTPALF